MKDSVSILSVAVIIVLFFRLLAYINSLRSSDAYMRQ